MPPLAASLPMATRTALTTQALARRAWRKARGVEIVATSRRGQLACNNQGLRRVHRKCTQVAAYMPDPAEQGGDGHGCDDCLTSIHTLRALPFAKQQVRLLVRGVSSNLYMYLNRERRYNAFTLNLFVKTFLRRASVFKTYVGDLSVSGIYGHHLASVFKT